MNWYGYITGCIIGGSLGFILCSICTMAKRSDERMHNFNQGYQPINNVDTSNPPGILIGSRAERRRQWRKSWRRYEG